MTSEPPVPPVPPDSGELVPADPGGPQPPFNVTDAFNYGWKKFQENLGTILAATAILIIGGGALGAIWFLIVGAVSETDSDTFTGFFSVTLLFFSLAWFLLGFLIQAAVIRGALLITRGQRLELSHFLSTDNLGTVILASVLLALGTGVGYFLCFLPGVIFAFFSQFTLYYVVDKGMDAIEAIKASFGLVNRNLGSTVGLYIGVVIAVFIGALLCGIGLLVTIPVALIATAYAYRRMSGEAVAA